MIQEAALYMMKRHIDPFAYGEKGIYDGDEYIDTSQPSWADRLPRDAVLPLRRTSPLPDLLVGMPHFCLSERAYELFIRNLKIWERIMWVQVRAIDRNRRDIGRYWWPKHANSDFLNVLDLKNSTVEYYPADWSVGPGTVRKVFRWVLDARPIGDLDCFVGNELSWFASPKLRNLALAEKLTGFVFHPVAVSTPDGTVENDEAR